MPDLPSAPGPYPKRPGNRLRPLIDGAPALRRIASAVETARHSIWLTAAFLSPDFHLPDASGTLFDLLDRAAARGLDVRAVIWHPNPGQDGAIFPAAPASHACLAARASLWHIRWDQGHDRYCQHQKSWIIDAGHPTETTFVGGTNLSPGNLGEPGHATGDPWHDCYLELAGPSATDVHHNFVQRWNLASERDAPHGAWNPTDDLAYPSTPSPPRGNATVQIQRMLPALYSGIAPEQTILTQYQLAIAAARHAIYIENQALPVPAIAASLAAALQRGVEIVLLAPASLDHHARAAMRRTPGWLEGVAALATHPNCTLATLRAPIGPVHVHAKLMLVDDSWATIGSCNLHDGSLGGHTELNAAIWHPPTVRALRCALLAKHLAQDTSHLAPASALRLFRTRHTGLARVADIAGYHP